LHCQRRWAESGTGTTGTQTHRGRGEGRTPRRVVETLTHLFTSACVCVCLCDRFTWIRDSSFTLYAFLKLGFKEEAAAFMHWISQRCEESSTQDGSLQIMYGLHGEHKLEEKHLKHLEGFKG